MRFVLYNIRYGTGGHHSTPFSGYLGQTADQLDRITDFLREQQPDIIGLIEVDEGSFRSRSGNQARYIAQHLGHYHTYRSKYKERGFWGTLPVLCNQGNAFVCRDEINERKFHYFERGMKRLVIELEFENLTVFLVHLALKFRTRHLQMLELYRLVRECRKPRIVAGDFNAFCGEREIELFLAATGLCNPNSGSLPSYPSANPRRHLDFILHSSDIECTGFSIPQVRHSDHLPLVFDFELPAVSAPAADCC